MRNKLINSMAALVIASGGMLLSTPSQAQDQIQQPGAEPKCCATTSCSCCGASSAACSGSCSCA